MEIFVQTGLSALTVEKLPDGSTAIVDNRIKSVHSLNPSATLVWEACAQGATADQIRESVESKSGSAVDAEVIFQALDQLERAGLIETSSPLPSEAINLGRRSLLRRAGAAGAIAIPVVLTLTASEQKAYAFQSLSGTTFPPIG